MQMAITEEDERTLQVLFDKRKDIDINHADNEGKTALLLGALSCHSRSVSTLLENRSDLAINAKLEDGRTALHIILENGLFFQPYYKRFDETNQVVKELLGKYKDVVEINARDVHGRTVSHVAAQFGRFDALNTILEICHDMDVDSADRDGRTILHYTAARGHMDVIVLSLGNRDEADPESDGEDKDKESDEVERNCSGEEEGDDAPEVTWSGIDSVEQYVSGDSESDDATTHCNETMALFLEKCNNATIKTKDNRGLTAFHLASLAKNGRFFEDLLSDDRGIDVNAQDNYGWTALHIAVFYRCTKVVKTLLTKCASININIQDRKGQTPLHLAASKGRVKMLKTLLDNVKDVNLNLEDKNNQTALDLAVEGNYVEVVDMLRAANGHAFQEAHEENGSD